MVGPGFGAAVLGALCHLEVMPGSASARRSGRLKRRRKPVKAKRIWISRSWELVGWDASGGHSIVVDWGVNL